jgi:flagellar biosynthesis/type III secretory pathway chaperone
MSNITSIIEQEVLLVVQFIDLLEREQSCLKHAEPELLEQLCLDKEPLVKSLNELEFSRIQSLGGAGSLSNQAFMNIWLAQNPDNKSATVHWEKLLKLASKAKALNEINNQLVQLHLAKTNAALLILNNQPESRQLYSSNGQSAFITGSRIVDSA